MERKEFQQRHNLKSIFWVYRTISILRNGTKRKNFIQNSFESSKLSTETLFEETKHIITEIVEFECRVGSISIQLFGFFGRAGFRCQVQIQLFFIQLFPRRGKLSIGFLMAQTKPVVRNRCNIGKRVLSKLMAKFSQFCSIWIKTKTNIFSVEYSFTTKTHKLQT